MKTQAMETGADPSAGAASGRPDLPGDAGWGRRMAEMIRVDHAGEYGAVAIYRGQRAVLAGAHGKARIAGQIAEMEREEQRHLDAFDALIRSGRARPTALAPLWNAAGFALGATTALLGERAAHACTAAVEEVIDRHYQDQIAELGSRDPAFSAMVESFRQDEVAHRDLAISEGAREAPGYRLLSAAIRLGCRLAIRISEKV